MFVNTVFINRDQFDSQWLSSHTKDFYVVKSLNYGKRDVNKENYGKNALVNIILFQMMSSHKCVNQTVKSLRNRVISKRDIAKSFSYVPEHAI